MRKKMERLSSFIYREQASKLQRVQILDSQAARRASLAKVRDLLDIVPEVATQPDDPEVAAAQVFVCRHCTASSLRHRASRIAPHHASFNIAGHPRPINRHSIQDSERIGALRALLHRGSFDARQRRTAAHSHSCGRWQASTNPTRSLPNPVRP
ncbi:hypothetical protein [Paraburkholderia aromaticivorans]|uniref:hypothetical protein n=1 Tax=Paraburkholderia aromaticivorans TaxID=2026199 RepID=UPI00197DC7E9|nr:hypothetical protein [Paraburkholderia aromaticivorans]